MPIKREVAARRAARGTDDGRQPVRHMVEGVRLRAADALREERRVHEARNTHAALPDKGLVSTERVIAGDVAGRAALRRARVRDAGRVWRRPIVLQTVRASVRDSTPLFLATLRRKVISEAEVRRCGLRS